MYCPNAYAGLAVCDGLYEDSQFKYVCYEDNSGGLNNPDSQTRIGYYGVTGFPTLRWDGYQQVVGAGSGEVDGHTYIPIIDNHFLNTTPVACAVTDWSFDHTDAFVDVKVKLFGDLASNASTYIRVVLIEDDLTYGGHEYYTHICRKMLPNAAGTPLTIQNDGEEQTLHLPFTMGTWNATNMNAIVFVQRDTDKFIYNSSNSEVGPYSVQAAVNGPQQVIAQGSDPIVFGTTSIVNVGTEQDTYDISLDTSSLPAGWSAHFTHDGVDGTSTTVTLDPFTSTDLVVTMMPGASGSGRTDLTVFSQAGQEVVKTLTFAGLAGGTDLLVVADDDGAGLTDPYFGPAIMSAGKSYATWERSLGPVDGNVLTDYDAVIWECGSTNPGLRDTDRAALDTYLAAGGSLLITGQDVAQDLAAEGSSASLWMQFKTRCRFLNGNSNNFQIDGESGDVIGDGLSFTLNGGDGANDQTDPDVIETLTADAIPVFHYGDGSLAGSRIEISGYKLVFLAFGFEGISSQADRDMVMHNSLDWLIGTTSTPVEDQAPKALALAQNQPNPFNPMTKIAFALNQRGPVSLQVFDLQGRLVRTLLAGEAMAAGDHAVVWNGLTDAGQQAASGTYVYRLDAGNQRLTRKMLMVK